MSKYKAHKTPITPHPPWWQQTRSNNLIQGNLEFASMKVKAVADLFNLHLRWQKMGGAGGGGMEGMAGDREG